jgi:hypothetical protein
LRNDRNEESKRYQGYDQIRQGFLRDCIYYDAMSSLPATEKPCAYFFASLYDQEEVRREYSRDCLKCLDSQFERIALNMIYLALTISCYDHKTRVKVLDSRRSIVFSTYFGAQQSAEPCLSRRHRAASKRSSQPKQPLWEILWRRIAAYANGHKDSAYSVAFAPNCKDLVSGSLVRRSRCGI